MTHNRLNLNYINLKKKKKKMIKKNKKKKIKFLYVLNKKIKFRKNLSRDSC
jgi:hypothetical protein